MTNNENELRISGGYDFYYKTSTGTWTSFGIVKYGYELDDSSELTDIQVAGGDTVSVEKSSTRKVTLEIAQTSKDALELRDTLNGEAAMIYVYDGVVGSNHLELVIKEAVIRVNIKKKEGDSPQTVSVTLQMKRQSETVSVQDTDLPTVKRCAEGTYTGKNKYYLWIETAVS